MISDLDGDWESRPEEMKDFRDHQMKVHWPLLLLFLAAEGQNVLHQLLGPAPGGQHFLQILPRSVFVRDSAEGQLGVPEDSRQDVVEVVRDATCQGPDSFHLLRLAHLGLALMQPFLCSLAFGDVH